MSGERVDARAAAHGRRTARGGARRRCRVSHVVVQYAVARRGLPAAPTRAPLGARGGGARRRASPCASSARARGARSTVRYRGKDYATNVLTFVYDDGESLAGDIVLCAPVLRREARAQGKTLTAHCAHLVVHGMLHLQGYDHERDADAPRMEARETALLAALGYPDPYADVTRRIRRRRFRRATSRRCSSGCPRS